MHFLMFFWLYSILAGWSTWQWVFLSSSQNFWSFDTPVCASAVIWNRFKQFLLKCSCNSKICTLKLRAEVRSTIQFLSNFRVLLMVYGLTILHGLVQIFGSSFQAIYWSHETSENNSKYFYLLLFLLWNISFLFPVQVQTLHLMPLLYFLTTQ